MLQALERFAESGMNQEANAASNEFEQDKLQSLFRMSPQYYSFTATFMMSGVGSVSFNSCDNSMDYYCK